MCCPTDRRRTTLKVGTVVSALTPLRSRRLSMSEFLRELRAARAAREARIELRASVRVTTALEAAVDAASTLESAETIAGRADGRNPGVGPGVENVEPDLLPSSARRRRRGGDLLSDEALRRIVDRIHAQHVEESDANARLRAAIRGLEPNEFASLPDDTWPGLNREDGAARPDECAVCYVGFEDGDALKVLPCGHSQFHLGCIRTWLQRSPTCPLCRCACRPPRVDLLKPTRGISSATNPEEEAPSGTLDREHPATSTAELRLTLDRLRREHEEESAWLDSLEAQPRFVPEGAVVGGAVGVADGDAEGADGEEDADATRRAGVRERARRYFDPLDTEYMRRNYGELYRLREEERTILARLDALSVHEDALRVRLEDARDARERQRARVGAEEAAASVGGGVRRRWLRNGEVDATRGTGDDVNALLRGAPAAALEQVAAERTRASVVNAMDAIARWRRNGDE